MSDRETIKLPGGCYLAPGGNSLVGRGPIYDLYLPDGNCVACDVSPDDARAFAAAIHQPGAVAGELEDVASGASSEVLSFIEKIARLTTPYDGIDRNDQDAVDAVEERITGDEEYDSALTLWSMIEEARSLTGLSTQDGASGAGVSSGGVPEGFVLVPEAPTEAMILAGHNQIDWCRSDHPTDNPSRRDPNGGTSCGEDVQDAWSAMLAARPKPPAVPAPGDGGAAVDVAENPFEAAYETMCATYSKAVGLLDVFKKRAAVAEAERDEARTLAQQARAQALEEAARVAESFALTSDVKVEAEAGLDIATAIRALNTAPDRGQDEGWRPIETAPRDGTPIFVTRDMGEPWRWVRGTGRWDGAKGIYGWICRGISDPPGELGLGHPTHWMSLPAPPASPDRGQTDSEPLQPTLTVSLWTERKGIWKRPGAIVRQARVMGGFLAWKAIFEDGGEYRADTAEAARNYADDHLAATQPEQATTAAMGGA